MTPPPADPASVAARLEAAVLMLRQGPGYARFADALLRRCEPEGGPALRALVGGRFGTALRLAELALEQAREGLDP